MLTERVVRAGGGRCVALAGDVNRFLATGHDTEGAFAQWEVVVGPGRGPVPHIHSRESESILVLSGRIVVHVGQESAIAEAGAFISLPRHVPHWFRNESAENARLLFTIAPAGLEQFFFDCGTEIPADSTAVPLPAQEELDRIHDRAPTYGLTILPPVAVA